MWSLGVSGRNETGLLLLVVGFGLGAATILVGGRLFPQDADQVGVLRGQLEEVRTNLVRLDNQIHAMSVAVSNIGVVADARKTNGSSQTPGQTQDIKVTDDMAEQNGADHKVTRTNPQPPALPTAAEETQRVSEIINKFQAEYNSMPGNPMGELMSSEEVRSLSPQAKERVLQEVVKKLNTGEIDPDRATNGAGG